MNKEAKRELRCRLLKDNKAYQTLDILTRYMDRYYLDALLGLIPGWGDAIALFSVVPFIYFSLCIIKSIPLTLAILNNALRDFLFGLIPFFVGDIIDIFHRANIQNLELIQGFIDGDKKVIRKVNMKAIESVVVLILLMLLTVLMIWALVTFGSYLYSLVKSLF